MDDNKAASAGKSAHYRRSRQEQSWQDEGQRLLTAIKTHEWFLDSSFSLLQLSERVALNTNYASHALNYGLGTSFKNILNELRVDFAKRLIKQDRESLLTIALNSGFGSKASFNRVFLKLTHQTPSQYRYQSRQESRGKTLAPSQTLGGGDVN
ncbi:MAG: AraC family transcriptional regulator [Hellea sp.]